MSRPPLKKPTQHNEPLILVTHEFFPHRGGIAVYATEMARAAQDLGYAVEVWAPALAPGVLELPRNYQIERLPMAGDHSLLSQWRMARRLIAERKRLRSAILYVPEPGPLLALLFLQYFDRLKPAQLVLTFHGSEIQWLASRWILRWSTTHLLRKATRIGVVSAFALDLLRQHFPAAVTKAVITPGALRTDLTSCALERLPHPKPKTIILTVARLNPRKGQLQVIAALQALPADQLASLEYWLVGSHGKDKYDDALATAAQAADFPVKFLGDIPDDQLSDIYAQADIFAMTSMPHKQSIEGFGLVYLEAGAHGLPIIAHAIGGVPEAVAHGETGLLVAPDDIAALTAAFAQLIADPALRHRLGEAGRIRAIRHTWTDAVQSLLGQPTNPNLTA